MAVMEIDHPPVGSGQVGHDEADARIEFALVPLDFGHNPTRSGPAVGLVAEAGERHDRLLRRAADRPGQQVPDPPLQHLVWLTERRIGAKVEDDAPVAGMTDARTIQKLEARQRQVDSVR